MLKKKTQLIDTTDGQLPEGKGWGKVKWVKGVKCTVTDVTTFGGEQAIMYTDTEL